MKLHRRGSSLPTMVLSLLVLSHAQIVAAQGEAWLKTPRTLRGTPQLPEPVVSADRGMWPSLIEGDRLSGRPDLEAVVEGNASLRQGDLRISADRLEYRSPGDLAIATGSVHLNQAGNVYEGPELQLKVETSKGFFAISTTLSWRAAATARRIRIPTRAAGGLVLMTRVVQSMGLLQ